MREYLNNKFKIAQLSKSVTATQALENSDETLALIAGEYQTVNALMNKVAMAFSGSTIDCESVGSSSTENELESEIATTMQNLNDIYSAASSILLDASAAAVVKHAVDPAILKELKANIIQHLAEHRSGILLPVTALQKHFSQRHSTFMTAAEESYTVTSCELETIRTAVFDTCKDFFTHIPPNQLCEAEKFEIILQDTLSSCTEAALVRAFPEMPVTELQIVKEAIDTTIHGLISQYANLLVEKITQEQRRRMLPSVTNLREGANRAYRAASATLSSAKSAARSTLYSAGSAAQRLMNRHRENVCIDGDTVLSPIPSASFSSVPTPNLTDGSAQVNPQANEQPTATYEDYDPSNDDNDLSVVI